MAGDSRFTWEYDDGRDRLLADLDLLMRTDEEIAERPDQERLAAEEAAGRRGHPGHRPGCLTRQPLNDLVNPAMRVGELPELDAEQFLAQPHTDRSGGAVSDRPAAR